MTSDVTLTNTLANAQQTQQQSITLANDFSDFLTLLTTQLQNQDPLSPMDSTEFTNQLVQFSQVEQSINTNQKLDDMLALQLGSISSVALGYVGMDASYLGNEFAYDGTSDAKITYAMSEDAYSAKMYIYNESGELVYSDDAPTSIGSHEMFWDGSHSGGGTVEPGTYSVQIDALDPDGNVIDTSTVVSGRVRGIESQNGVIFLLIGERAVPLNSIINATLPTETAADDAEVPAEEQQAA
ncbi:MAG: flagellar hook capping family protein [Rhodospirillales bacterium]|nr:flagellar hook capping family protein [Rhodospirillales bacterium]